MARHTFVFTDENVLNSYGFRILNAGGRFDQFNSNPIILWMHRRPSRWNDKNEQEEVFPIGLGYNIRFENGKGFVDIEFDSKDPFAQKIEQKVESGIIRMCSPGVSPITWTEDAKFLLPGQKAATLKEWNLEEISVVDIGSNPNALKLYNSKKELVELTAGNQNDIIPLLKQQNNKKHMEFLQQVAVMLGKEPDAAQDSVLKSLKDRLQLANQAEDWKGKYEILAGEVTLATEKNITQLVDSNLDKKITADKRDFYVKLGKESGIETLKTVIEALPNITSPSKTMIFTRKPEGEKDGEEIKTFADLKAKGKEAVELFRKENAAEYTRLFKAEYGFEPDIKD